ncbi:polyketide synthase [Xylariomycetidae sp. FL2044]|nr:polyketide synthase [Xylariomycetidae sp. FL2044]
MRNSEPIAIVGMACHLPGGVDSSEKLWEFLRSGGSGQCDIPPSRFNVEAFYHPDSLERPGSMHTQGEYFLQEDPKLFDPEFFNILPVEAAYMDPQQRKLLEVVYKTLESSGVTLEQASGANVGCYVASFTTDYQTIQARDPEYFHRYAATGMGTTILSNRISHTFNLKGPSLVIDTACSSSLHCLYVACNDLINQECDAALVAGANLIQSPEQHMAGMKAGVLSPTSTCHTFSNEADGYGRAEAVGCLYLKRLDDAIRDNDPVRAIISAVAVNSNGKTPGITHPSVVGQEAVIRKAYEKARCKPDETGYMECHGTGTPIGDPIELEAVSKVFAASRDQPLLVGSVKPNLGHAEAASAITGVIKAALAMEHGRIPRTIGIKSINPNIKLSEWNLAVVRDEVPFPSYDPSQPDKFRASVNSFGYGGANAHAILESAACYLASEAHINGKSISEAHQAYILPISANNPQALEVRLRRLNHYFSNHRHSISDTAYTLGERRTHFSSRGYVIANQDNLTQAFDMTKLHVASKAPTKTKSEMVFVFTGQGAQWPLMGKDLYHRYPVFAKSIDDLDTVLAGLPHAPTWTLREAITELSQKSEIDEASRAQPACTAIQIALVDLLASWHIAPTSVIGHSSGEIAAAFAAGFMSASEAITAAYYRGFVVSKSARRDGSMLAVGLSAQDAMVEINAAGLASRIMVACINSLESTTVSGDLDAVDILAEAVAKKHVFCRKLATNGRAYHSHHMTMIGEEYEDLLSDRLGALPREMKDAPRLRWYSTVTGKDKTDIPTAAYWRANLESPVEFSAAMNQSMHGNKVMVVEIGPHGVMKMPTRQIWASRKAEHDLTCVPTLQRGQCGVKSMLSTVGELYLHGQAISWDKVNGLGGRGKMLPDLPPYVWTYGKPLWNECRASFEFRNRAYPQHELLGSLNPGGNGIERTWRNRIKLAYIPWLSDHKLQQNVVFPGACYLAMVMEASLQANHLSRKEAAEIKVEKMSLLSALILSEGSDFEMFTTLRPTAMTSNTSHSEWFDFSIVTYESGQPTIRSTGLVRCMTRKPGFVQLGDNPSSKQALLEYNHPRGWYSAMEKVGLNYGPTFQTIDEFRVPRLRSEQTCEAVTTLFRSPAATPLDSIYSIHPVTLDAMLQAALVASCLGNMHLMKSRVPIKIKTFTVHIPEGGFVAASPCWINSKSRTVAGGNIVISSQLGLEKGDVACEMSKVRSAFYDGGGQASAPITRSPISRIQWKPDPFGLGPITEDKFAAYLDWFSVESTHQALDRSLLRLCGALDLLAHKNPRLRVLEVVEKDDDLFTNAALELVGGSNPHRRFLSWTRGIIGDDEETHGAPISLENNQYTPLANYSILEENQFDLILLTNSKGANSLCSVKLSSVYRHLPAGGMVLEKTIPGSRPLGGDHGFESVQAIFGEEGGVFMARRVLMPETISNIHNSAVYVVDRWENGVSRALTCFLKRELGHEVERISLTDIAKDGISKGSVVVSLLEMDKPLLSEMNEQISQVKEITDHASRIVWVTSTDLIEGARPESALAFGLSRAIKMEQPSTEFYVLDVDDISLHQQRTFDNLLAILQQQETTDTEFAQRDGVVHVSRFVPDDSMNTAFQRKQDQSLETMKLHAAGPVKLVTGETASLDTLHFEPVAAAPVLKPDHVQVSVKSVGLNAKDYYALTGRVDTKDNTCALEFCGVIERVGCNVSDLRDGDRVVVMAPAHFRTSEVVPRWACIKLLDHECFNVMCTLPVVFASALYSLRDRAQLQEKETVLIHSAAGGLGIAAIQVAQRIGAEIFATVSTTEKADFLVDHYGLARDHIFSSKDTSFLQGIITATNGDGVDVVVNSLSGELLHASWKCCGSFGRFVELGKKDLIEFGKLEMEMFLRNTTFTAFDLTSYYSHEEPRFQMKWSGLLTEVITLFRSGQIHPVRPLSVFSVGNVIEAFRWFGSRNRLGKVVVNFENGEDNIVVRTSKHSTKFCAEKWYFMVGCLGGLGRSICRWMVSRGARRFVFLGRSGASKPAAKILLEDLELSGAQFVVVKGDVCSKEDVDQAVAAVDGKIGGVVQGAMDLSEELFTKMTASAWHTGIDPKVKGTWNLHQSIKGKDDELEFFLLMSSVAGSIGTATESNYCTGNSFLDFFARYRRSLGLPAISIGLGMISEVGYLHENPDIEKVLLRRGIQAITEEEMLLILDMALSSSHQIPYAYDDLSHAHILTGMELLGFRALRENGFEGTHGMLEDPRAAVFLQSIGEEDPQVAEIQNRRVPVEVKVATREGQTLEMATRDYILKRFCGNVLIPVERVDTAKSLVSYGMDSMLAADFRSWIFKSFGSDIAFHDLLSPILTLDKLIAMVIEEVQGGC